MIENKFGITYISVYESKHDIVCLAVIFSVLFSRVEELEQIIEHTENTAKVFDCA